MTKHITNILVPVDFSPGSYSAVDYAVGLALAHGAALTLFHAQEPLTPMSQIVPGADGGIDLQANKDRILSGLQDLAARIKRERALELSVAIGTGFPTEQILSKAEEGRFDLIVMGTHGRTGMGRFIMGSVAETVVRRSHCPVLTVHLPRQNEEI